MYDFTVGSILLVEADPETCGRWSADLGGAGHAVLTATAMRDALSTIREGGIDVVVIDAYDPCVGVVELAAALEHLPDTPPLVLVSVEKGHDMHTAMEKGTHYVFNILSSEKEALSRRFAAAEPDRFKGVSYRETEC